MVDWTQEKYLLVEFFGQDHKAKIPVGDKVAISTGVWLNTIDIFAVDDEIGL